MENPSTSSSKRPASPSTLDRELWVFWLDDKWQVQNHGLERLQERQSGNLTWDSILQNNNPATVGTSQASAPRSAEQPGAAKEYEMLMRGLRNVLDRGMVAKGGYRLGSSYVFPASLQPRLDGSILPNFPKMPSIPHGTPALLRLQDMAEFTEEQTQKCLDGWADHFGTNQDLVNEISRSLPRLVAVSVKSGQNEVAPSDVGQLDGMGSRNLGFIEDLGAKFAIWSWQEKTRNAIASPAVPKLVQPVSEHTPVLAEPRNRLKAGSSAWQQQQQQIQQQLIQQQQQQQQQQQSQNSFLQQQQDALAKRSANSPMYDTNRIDYWSYTDPYAYLTSIVLNSCANAEPKGADSPSAADNQVSIVIPVTPTAKPVRSRPNLTRSTTGTKEADGWIRVRPRRNTLAPPSTHNFSALDTPDTNQAAWGNGLDSESMPASENESNNNNSTQFNPNTSNDPSQVDAQNTSTNNSSYQLPIDLPADNNDMMSGLMDVNSMMGLYGAGTSDDLEDWGVVTKDDFSFFDEQPRSAPAPRSLPMVPEISFDNLQSSIPMSSTALSMIHGASSAISSVIPTTNGVMPSFPDGMMTSSPIDDDDLLENMDLDLSSFGNMASPSTAILPPGGVDRVASMPPSSSGIPPIGDQPPLHQASQDINIQTPNFQAGEKELVHLDTQNQQQHQHVPPHQPSSLQLTSPDAALVKRSSILVTHLHSPLHSFIPSSFSPLKIVGDGLVDDSKYKAGGRFAYRRLYKRRKSSIPDPLNLYRRESKMLPFYQPGKDQDWILPPRKEKQRKKVRSQSFITGINWSGFKPGGSISILQGSPQSAQQKADVAKPGLLVRSVSTPVTAWGLSSYPLHSTLKRKKGDEGTSDDSDSDSTSTSSTDNSDDDSSIASTNTSRPQFGRLSRKRDDDGGFGGDGQAEAWTVRGVNSAKFVATILDQAMYSSAGSSLLSLDSASTPQSTASGGAVMGWRTADAYHSEIEFDTPFTPVIFSAAPPALVEEPSAVQESLASEFFLEAVRTFCEQAVLGDYPFAGSNEVTGTSGEITEGESFHVMLARRKILNQQLNDGVATVPALGDESFRNVMEIKTVIFDLLDRLRGNPSDETIALPVPSEAAQEMGMGITTLHGHHHRSSQSNIIPPVVMKGPLTLLQYFTLGEAQQMPSKYGKYQVKKKKTAEPALMQLQPPDIVVGHNEDWLEASPTILRFWEKLSLGPYSNRKHIAYFVVYPESADMEDNVSRFWRELSVVFETSLLGRHQPGVLQDYKPGLVPIPLLPALAGESMETRQVRSYIDGCQRLGALLGADNKDKDVHTVIYMINPFPHGAGYFDLCRCFSIMKTQFRSAMSSMLTPLEQPRENLVLQLVPIQHVVNPSTFGGYLLFGLKDIAFTVYAKCKVFLERTSFSRDFLAQINSYAPLFALAKTTPPTIHFDVLQKPNSMPKPPATLHVGYGFSLDGRWLICVWTDHRGELLEHLVLDMTDGTSRMLMSGKFSTSKGGNNNNSRNKDNDTSCLPLLAGIKEIWNRTLVYQKRGSFNWKTVISKLGLMTRTELHEWTQLTAGTNYTAVVAVNIDSAMRMYPHNRGADYLSSGMTPNTSGVNTPTNPGLSQAAGLGVGTPLAGSNPMLSTPLSQSMVPNITTSSTAASTPDVATAPATPLNFVNAGNGGLNNAGATGLGIAGAGGGPSANVGGMAGIGGVAGNEILENSAGQVYAMILNHRIPLIVSQLESGLSLAGSGRRKRREEGESRLEAQADVSDTKPTIVSPKEEPEEGEYDSKDIQLEDSIMSTPLADLDQDLDMEPQIKQEETSDQHRLLKADNIDKKKELSSHHSAPAIPLLTGGNDVIVPLSSGYLIQVPIQSNSVMREKHALEALGVEIHLLHLQRIPPTTPPPGPKSGPTAPSSPRRPMTGKEFLAAYRPSSPSSVLSYQKARAGFPMTRNPLHPITPKYVPYRPSNFVLPHYRPQPAAPAAASPTSSSGIKNVLSQSPGGSVGKGSVVGMAPDTGGASGSGTSVGAGAGTGAGTGTGAGASATAATGGEKGVVRGSGDNGAEKGGEMGGDKKGSSTTPNTTAVKGTVAASSTREILKQFHALSYLSQSPVQTNCLPNHLMLVERLSRVLLLVNE
ncbi:mediator of RNA polymerase II transcription subunit 13 [Linnemannia exigua]|uniref:Mediator of RNA polymerase II transcription subunit 13 n=1 Tax=Linnemannia exigua TaxID=604196 RepID=A0AAD4DCE5_9FUNG|nr:mediator of RNA polymerase II transcription subunit 13 [Linnemannia exigua]